MPFENMRTDGLDPRRARYAQKPFEPFEELRERQLPFVDLSYFTGVQKEGLHAGSAFTFKNPGVQAIYDNWIAPFAELAFGFIGAYGLIHASSDTSALAILGAGPLAYGILWLLHKTFRPSALEGPRSRGVYAMMKDSALVAIVFSAFLAIPTGMPMLSIPLAVFTVLLAANLLVKHLNLNRNGIYGIRGSSRIFRSGRLRLKSAA